ncbi:hypothetical protein DPM19_21805 [Actinomadura craniellae]|uniref:L,D-TPase catalytic domain-containing protein n=1 Tax=Actinomadura craniellae TaxID=2231787 RepID=A0A365H261_9ACTN|nr:Ig-like domain-containing protein [Actinomadura craniellae]RAY13129.1 hypothetical protein DPM19_21805 [Actinomadura craniellae]
MRFSVYTPAGRRGQAIGATAICLVLAAGCTGGPGSKEEAAKHPLKLTVTPAHAAGGVRPDSPIEVRAVDGTIQNVIVRTGNKVVDGMMSADRTRWRSRWTLDPGARYLVTASGVGRDGKTRSVVSTFTTLKPEKTLEARIEGPFDREKVGVGMPIILRFETEVTDRAAVERAMEIRSSAPVRGAWHWFDDQHLVFRTDRHWRPGTKVRFVGHLSGVQAAKGVYGGEDLKADFQIGAHQSSIASEDSHRMVVWKDGKRLRTFKISMGKGGIRKYTTTNGNHLTMEKAYHVVMDSATVGCPPGCPDYYREDVYWTVRISNSGEYTHSAPWSLGSQGSSNVSHGCVNMSPADAKWFYHFSQRGDPYKVTGTSRELEPNNGWGFWQLPWHKWVRGSALKQTLLVGPGGAVPAPLPAPAPAAPSRSASATPHPEAGAASPSP